MGGAATSERSGGEGDPPLRVLFVMRSAGFLRNFNNALHALLARGHEVTIAIERGPEREGTSHPLIEGLSRAGAVFVPAPSRREEPHHRAATQIRLALDYLPYLDASYDASKLRARAGAAVAPMLRPLVRHAAGGHRSSARLIRQALLAAHVTSPVSPSVESFLDEHPCDLIAVTPLVELGAPQSDWLRAAHRRDLPTALAVASWDNLTVKGRIRETPDRVLVWNELQRAEASLGHGLEPQRVVVTGAHSYDHWFGWSPSRDRATFCVEVGLRADRAIVLYTCSSRFIAPDEAAYVRSWIERLRRSTRAELRDVGVLVRPHPQHAAQWSHVGLDDLEQVSVWPRGGADPVARTARADFYDSIHHSSAVMGVNTSAMIECAIVGRPVLTLLDGRYAQTQGGTPHFAHIADPARGILTVASTAADHHAQIARAIAGEDEGWQERRIRFLDLFVRPHGIDESAAPHFADALEELRRLHRNAAAAAGSITDRATPAHRGAALVWRWAPLAPAFAAADWWTRRGDRRWRLTVEQARLGPKHSAAAPARCIDRLIQRAHALR